MEIPKICVGRNRIFLHGFSRQQSPKDKQLQRIVIEGSPHGSAEKMGKKSGEERKSEKVGGEERKGGVTGDESARAQRREKETVKRRHNAGSDHCLSSCAPGLSMLPSSV